MCSSTFSIRTPMSSDHRPVVPEVEQQQHRRQDVSQGASLDSQLHQQTQRDLLVLGGDLTGAVGAGTAAKVSVQHIRT